MADYAPPSRRSDARTKAASAAPPAARDRALDRRTAERDSRHAALLAGRARGPEPVQRRADADRPLLARPAAGTGVAPIQRIELDPDESLVVTVASSATKHGYSEDSIKSIVRNRLSEVEIGAGKDQNAGRLVYNCVKDGKTYRVSVFHAHGGQTESGNTKGY
jgi:hypothetical protein